MKLYTVIKRAADFFFSLIMLIILSPLFLIISIAIKFDSRGPVFFRQKRIGKNKKEFYILKFRSMSCDAPQNMPTHEFSNSDSYITSTGSILRKTSLDELPQLINMLRGEMSLIGPRPALWNQYDLIKERDKYGANDVIPGLTGWAQINGRDRISIEEKARLDGEYVKNYGFLMDIKVFFRSILSVLKREDIVEGELSSTPEDKSKEKKD